ncbi:hypothetical protein QP938_07615 [Porticoccaceae bacterium LTM1]|nr:hypothetical protein QP938_07615 [Porticoccaceae bacterium LTM1]
MKRLKWVLLIAGMLVFDFANAGPAAKFAATYTDERPSLVSVVVIDGATQDSLVFDLSTGYTLATLKVPQDKELLIGVSSEVGIVTDTSIKGRNGGDAKAIAGGGAAVVVFAVPVDGANGTAAIAAPGPVMLSARVQELSATLGGVIESCEDTLGGGELGDEPDGVIDVATECVVTDEEIGLALSTLASHHFNFVLPNMDQGEYNLVAFFVTGALAKVDINELSVSEGGTVEASAYAKAFLGKTMVTAQQVRATKGGVIDADIVE